MAPESAGAEAGSFGESATGVAAGFTDSAVACNDDSGRALLGMVGFFPKKCQAVKPRVTAEVAHTVRAIRKGTKREARGDTDAGLRELRSTCTAQIQFAENCLSRVVVGLLPQLLSRGVFGGCSV